MATLLAIRGPLTGARIDLEDEVITIGRSPKLTLSLNDATVSRLHARISRDRLGWVVEDAGSSVGTWLNGERVEKSTHLKKNDEIRIGHSIFLFDSDFDLQNADFTDNSVYFSNHNDDTMELAPVAVLSAEKEEDRDEQRDRHGVELLTDIGDLFDSARVPFGEALKGTTERMARLLGADVALLMLYDSLANRLRPSAVVAKGNVLTDSSVLHRVFQDRKAILLSDKPDLMAHPAAGAPAAPQLRSVLAAPLPVDGNCLGIVYFERHELDAYSLKDLRLVQSLGRLLAVFVEARQRVDRLELKARYDREESNVVGGSRKFRRMMDVVQRVAPTMGSILLIGETGTGKEVLAREIHRIWSKGNERLPLVCVNCAAIPETLFESEVFGHEKGAFTGANRLHQGLVERAHGGTLFLDEIGELSVPLQPKLLRFLQEHTFSRVGGKRLLRADVRVIAATNRDLEAEVRQGRFREDLYHRLAVLPVEVPPLRDRPEDVRRLAEHYINAFARRLGRKIHGISEEALIALEKYPWPGNVRELANCMERAVLLCDEKILLPRHLSLAMGEGILAAGRPSSSAIRNLGTNDLIPRVVERANGDLDGVETLADVERRHILNVLDTCGGNQARASEALGIHRNTLRKKLQEFGVV